MKRYRRSVHSGRGPLSAIDQERKIADLIYHTRDIMRRNDLLQEALDRANARIAKMQTVSAQ